MTRADFLHSWHAALTVVGGLAAALAVCAVVDLCAWLGSHMYAAMAAVAR